MRKIRILFSEMIMIEAFFFVFMSVGIIIIIIIYSIE